MTKFGQGLFDTDQFDLRGRNLMESPIMRDALFSGINGTGFKNHSAALFMDDGFVVWEKIIPKSIIIKNLIDTRAPSLIP